MKKTLILLLSSSFLLACSQTKVNADNTSNTNLQQATITEKPATEQTTKTEPMSNTETEQPVKTLIEAMAAKDAEKIRAAFIPNASQAYGDGPKKSGADFFNWLESDIIEREGHVTNPTYTVDGNQVVVKGQYNSIGYTNKADFLFSVKDGKVASWQMRY